MADNIKTKIIGQNLAPIKDLGKEINSSSLNFAIYANNGEGKTFISNSFRILEKTADELKVDSNHSPTDKFISFGKKSSKFGFKITDKQGVKEDFTINYNLGKQTAIPESSFIYHVFNQDFIDENSKVNYDKDGNIKDFIIGKANIDVSEDEAKLKTATDNRKELFEKTSKLISSKINKSIDLIPNIKRLSEYRDYLNFKVVYADYLKPWTDINRSFKEYMEDFDKVKSVPENLPKLSEVLFFNENLDFIKITIEKLKEPFELSKIADEFKEKVLKKQAFVEKGLELLSEQTCPFCEQELKESALSLIDNYTSFITDSETKTIRAFNEKMNAINLLIKSIEDIATLNIKAKANFDSYVCKYFTSSKGHDFKVFSNTKLITLLTKIIAGIEEKTKNISLPVVIEVSTLDSIISEITSINILIKSNNNILKEINSKLDNLGKENKTVRRGLCKSLFNELAVEYSKDFESLNSLKKDIASYEKIIRKKKGKNKINKRDRVLKSIKDILNYFFTEKYSLDEESFRLTFKKTPLNTGQAKDVLSEGEKTIIAFAYYIGDTHLKIKDIEDYKKLFFIIDDPISSMDFNHVYTMSGIIRDLKGILSLEGHTRFLIFTHNMEFMRILVANGIASKSLVLSNGELTDFNNNLTVPYICHLSSLCKISDGALKPDHTTSNSIRHIIETLTKFEHLELKNGAVQKYLEENFKHDIKIYTLINDLSHGAWRSEQETISESDFIQVCDAVVKHIDIKYKNQVEYCKTKLN